MNKFMNFRYLFALMCVLTTPGLAGAASLFDPWPGIPRLQERSGAALHGESRAARCAASSEIAFMEGINVVFNGWASDDQTANMIRKGFKSFKGLSKSEQALFDAVLVHS